MSAIRARSQEGWVPGAEWQCTVGGALGHSPYKLAALVETGREFGIDAEKILRGTGLTATVLDDPGLRTRIDQYLVAAHNAVDACADVELPFQVGRRLHLSTYGAYGFALLCSPTVRDAFQFAVRYHSLPTPIFRIASRETADGFVWFFPDELKLDLPPHLRTFLMAQQLSQHIVHVRDIARGDRIPRSIAIAGRPAGDPAVYETYLTCPVAFEAPATEIVYDQSVLDERPPLTNRTMLAMLRKTCEETIGKPGIAAAGFAREVAMKIMERPPQFPTMDEVAEEFRTTTRTLRRRLADEGLTFSVIVDDIRRNLATHYLETTPFAVDEIAELVGFSDPANFCRSFRRWAGTTPQKWRAREKTIPTR